MMYDKLKFDLFITCANLCIEFIKHRERCEYNFNYLKREMKEINTKIDDLRQLLLDVRDIFIEFNILLYKII